MHILGISTASFVTVFITGGSIMALQMLAARIMAPAVGTTITVWSAIIGVMLVALSIGYYLGGYLADTRIARFTLSNVLLSALVFVAVIIPLRGVIPLFLSLGFSYAVSAVCIAFLLFFLPTLFLGSVTVYVIRTEVHDLLREGKVNGVIYGTSTIGSLVGIFVTTFYLIPTYSVTTILKILACTVALALLVTFVREMSATISRA